MRSNWILSWLGNAPDADARPAQALRSLETGLDGWSLPKNWKRMTEQQVIYNLRVPNPERMVVIKQVGGPPSSICPHAPTGAL